MNNKDFSFVLYNHKEKAILPICYYDADEAFSDMMGKDNPNDFYVIVLLNQS